MKEYIKPMGTSDEKKFESKPVKIVLQIYNADGKMG